MAQRLIVIAAKDVSRSAFSKALQSCVSSDSRSPFQFGESECWQWATASVWAVDGAAIDQALSSLSCTATRTTTSDGILWVLSLFKPDSEPFRGVHFFTGVGGSDSDDAEEDLEPEEYYDDDFPRVQEAAGIDWFEPKLRFLWDDGEAIRLCKEWEEADDERRSILREYGDYGAQLPDDTKQKIESLPTSLAWRTAFVAHGHQIVDAIIDAGIEVDGGVLTALLVEGPLNEWEAESDLGNLPRFLNRLGINGIFDPIALEEPVASPDVEEEEDEPETLDPNRYPPGQLTETVEAAAQDKPLTDLEDGPVALNWIDCVLIHLFSTLFGEDESHVRIGTNLAVNEIPQEFTNLEALEISPSDRGCSACFSVAEFWDSAEQRSNYRHHALVSCLRCLPDGTEVTLDFVAESSDLFCHRYSGIVRVDCFEVHGFYPNLDRNLLRELIDTVALVVGPNPIDLLCPEELAAVSAAYHKETGEQPQVYNSRIKPEYGSRAAVVKCILFERFRGRGPWDLASAQQRVEESWRAYDQLIGAGADDDSDDADDEAASQLANAIQTLEETKKVPHHSDVIHTGRFATFYAASMSDLDHLDQNALDRDRQAMERLHFAFVVDLVANFEPAELQGCYAGAAIAIAILKHRKSGHESITTEDPDGYTLHDLTGGVREFQTHFADGTILLTRNHYGISSSFENKHFVRIYEEFSLPDLWKKHLQGIDLVKERFETTEIDHSLARDPVAMCELLDRTMEKRHWAE